MVRETSRVVKIMNIKRQNLLYEREREREREREKEIEKDIVRDREKDEDSGR